MPRPPRADAAGEIYHALNRGNRRMAIFHKDEDYEAFERVLNEGLEKYPVLAVDIFTRFDSRVFRSRVTSTFMWCAAMLNAMRWQPDW